MLLSGPSTSTVRRVATPIVQLREHWADDWQTVPEFKLKGWTRTAAGGQVCTADVFRDYGQVKLPWESALSYKPPWGSLTGWWLRIVLASGGTASVEFVGRIEANVRDPHGAEANGASGTQQWRAYGPQRILQKIGISKSYWLVGEGDGAEVKTMDWVPDVNRRDDADYKEADKKSPQIERGNRTATTAHDVYMYGGEEVWTNRQYVDYLLKKFVDESDDDGPAWTLTGQTDILDRLTETIPMSTTQTVAELLTALCPRRLGLDWTVLPTDDGFAVAVFALSPIEYQFGDAWMPANPYSVSFATSSRRDILAVRLVESDEQAFKTIRLLGNRVVVVGTLRGVACTEGTSIGSLVRTWTDEQETAYELAVTTAEVYPDLAHSLTTDQYRDLYSLLLLSDAADLENYGWTPSLAADGTYTTSDQWQVGARRTLDWTPLLATVDYTATPLDLGEIGSTDFLPPQAYLRRYTTGQVIFEGWVPPPTHDVYIGAAEAGFHVEAPRNALGVRIVGSANWELAKNHFPAVVPDDVLPLYDYEATVATLAWETDQRFGLEYTTDDAAPSDGVLEVEVPDANYWVLSADTVVGVTEDGELQTRATAVVLRQDNDRLLFVLAGILARYYGSRHRAEITVRDLVPWSGLLGQILRGLETDGTLTEMAAPITTITWSVSPDGSSSTTLNAGA